MKKAFLGIVTICLICFWMSCKRDNNTGSEISADSPEKEQWAELVESSTSLVKPEGWDEEYWVSVNKNMDKTKLFNSIVSAVISGKTKAYDIFTDSLLTVDEVKAMVTLDPANKASEDPRTTKVSGEDLSLIRMREKWIFNKEKFHLEKHVSRIDLIYKKLDENGEYIGDKPLFYVYLN
jgi:hypothetical protein